GWAQGKLRELATPYRHPREASVRATRLYGWVSRIFFGRRLNVDALRVVGGVVSDQRPGECGEFAGDGIEGRGLGQAFGLFSRVAAGEGLIVLDAGSGGGRQVEQAAEFGITLFGEDGSATQ